MDDNQSSAALHIHSKAPKGEITFPGHPMLRIKQELPRETCIEFLNRATSGTLALIDQDGLPYAFQSVSHTTIIPFISMEQYRGIKLMRLNIKALLRFALLTQMLLFQNVIQRPIEALLSLVKRIY